MTKNIIQFQRGVNGIYHSDWPKLILLVFLLFFTYNTSVNALTAKSPEQDAAMQWALAIQKYLDVEHRLPNTWNDLRHVESSLYFLNIINQRDATFEKSHRFLKSAIQVEISNETFKLIAMGMRTAIPDPRYLSHSDVRLAILSSVGGHIQPVTISVVQLTSALRKAGADINEYSGETGNWHPEPERGKPLPNTVNPSEGMKTNTIEETNDTPGPAKPNDSTIIKNQRSKVTAAEESRDQSGIWILFIAAVGAFLVWIYNRYRKSNR